MEPPRLTGAPAERARAVAAGRIPVAKARPGATVLLLRDAPDGSDFEVYIHHRHAGMRFAAEVVAFPGGGVDPVDYEGTDIGGDLPPWVSTITDDASLARAFVAAAIRETQEETGVTLTVDQLAPWAHWITPRYHERRYDTWFFVAKLPDGMDPADVSGEAQHVEWVRPAGALDRVERGELAMMPPTHAVLSDLASFASIDDAIADAHRRDIPTINPGWLDEGVHVRLLMPDDPAFPGDDPGEPGDETSVVGAESTPR